MTSSQRRNAARAPIEAPAVPPELYDTEYFLGAADGAHEYNAGVSHGRYWFAIDKLDLPPGGTLLDVGCGRGELLRLAAEHGAGKVIGVEYAEAAVDLAVEHVAEAGIADRCEIHLADARDLPVADDSVDAVTLMDVIEHLTPAEQDAAVREAHRVLRPGGMLLLHTFPNRRIYELYGAMRRFWPGGRAWPTDPRKPYEHEMHVGELTGEEIGSLFARAGYVEIEVSHLAWTYTEFVPTRAARRVFRLLARFPPTQSLARASIVGVARVGSIGPVQSSR